jgi:hypothetical protein
MDKFHISDYISSHFKSLKYLEINQTSPSGIFIESFKYTEKGMFVKFGKLFKSYLFFDWIDIEWFYQIIKKHTKPEIMRSNSTGQPLFIF